MKARKMTAADEARLIGHCTHHAHIWRPLTIDEFTERYGHPSPDQHDRIDQHVMMGDDGFIRPRVMPVDALAASYFIAMDINGVLFVATLHGTMIYWERMSQLSALPKSRSPINAESGGVAWPAWAVDFYKLSYAAVCELVA